MDRELIYHVIKNALTSVVDVRLVGQRTIEASTLMSLLDEMSKNSSMSVVATLETIEIEDACPVCGSDPAGKSGNPHLTGAWQQIVGGHKRTLFVVLLQAGALARRERDAIITRKDSDRQFLVSLTNVQMRYVEKDGSPSCPWFTHEGFSSEDVLADDWSLLR